MFLYSDTSFFKLAHLCSSKYGLLSSYRVFKKSPNLVISHQEGKRYAFILPRGKSRISEFRQVRNYLSPSTTITRIQSGTLPQQEGGRDPSKEGWLPEAQCLLFGFILISRFSRGKNILESLVLMHTWRNSLKGKSCSSMPSGCLKSNFPFSIFNMHSCNCYRELYLKCKSGQAIEIRPFS